MRLKTDSPYRHLKKILLFSAFIILSGYCISFADTLTPDSTLSTLVQPDTTNIREVIPESKSFGEVLGDVPGFILNAPFKILELLTKGVTYGIYRTFIRNFLDFENPYPLYGIADYGTNAGASGGMGLSFKNSFSEKDKLKLGGSYSNHKYQYYFIKYKAPHFFVNQIGIKFKADYNKQPWESFHGIGFDSDVNKEVAYNIESSTAYADFTWQVHSRLTFDIITGYSSYNIYDGQDDDRVRDIDSIITFLSLSPEYFRSSRFFSIGSRITFDCRDHKGQSSSGSLGELSFIYNHGTGRSNDLDFVKFKMMFSQYQNLWRKRLLALQVNFEKVDNITDGEVLPFYLMSSLGGIENLRGYRRNRFFDNDLASVSLEYRYPIWHVIDAFIFIDEGRTFENIEDDFTFERWKYSYGGGLRLWKSDGVFLMGLVAKSDEDTRVYLEVEAGW